MIIPMYDRVLAKKVELEQVRKSGIVIMNHAGDEERDNAFAEVVAVGEGKLNDKGERVPLTVKVGDVITYNERLPLKLKHEGEVFDILQEHNILAIIK